MTASDGASDKVREHVCQRMALEDACDMGNNSGRPVDPGTAVVLMPPYKFRLLRQARSSAGRWLVRTIIALLSHRLAPAVGIGASILGLLIGAGLFWAGGLEVLHLLTAVKSAGARVGVMGLLLLIGAAIFGFRQRRWLMALVPWVAAVGGYLIIGAIILIADTAPALGLVTLPERAQLFGLASVVFLALAATLVLRQGPRSGADRPQLSVTDLLSAQTSIGSAVLLLWTAVAIYALAIIGSFVILETLNPPAAGLDAAGFECNEVDGNLDADDRNCAVPGVWTDYLILLGVPGAAAAVTKIKGEERNADPEPPPDGHPTTTGVADIQYLVFNAFAMVYVLASLVQFGRLPEIPDLVLALTGASALTYTANRRVAPFKHRDA